MYFDVGSKQIQGGRDYQEDDYLVVIPGLPDSNKNVTLAVLTDGMGGHAGGAVASEVVVNTFATHFVEHYTDQSDVPDLLRESLFEANHKILNTITEQHELSGMGCTLVAVLLVDNLIYWISVGDSHLYLLRGDNVFKLNEDHSYGGFVDRLTAAGESIPETPGFKPRRNMLMSYVNGEQIAMIDQPDQPLTTEIDDRFILASDGLDTLSEEFFHEMGEGCGDAQTFANSLIGGVEVLQKRNQDNTTVVVLHCESDEAGPSNIELDPTPDTEIAGSILSNFDTIVDETHPELIQITTAGPNPERDQQVSNLNAYLDEFTDDVDTPEHDIDDFEENLPAETDDDFYDLPESDLFLESTFDDERLTAAPETPANTAYIDDDEETSQRSRSTGMVSILVVLLLLAGGGFYYFNSQNRETTIVEQIKTHSAEIFDNGKPTPITPTKSPTPTDPTATPQAKPATEKTVNLESTPAPLKQHSDKLLSGKSGPLMITLPGGTYQMGRPTSSSHFDERPLHDVTIPKFMISRYEISFADFDLFTQSTNKPRAKDQGWGRGNRPVINVSWQDAIDYTIWLSAQTRAKYRLPSEAEWEYAAAANQSSIYWWGYKIGQNNANCWGCGSQYDAKKTAPVGSFKPNLFGLHDTAGNVLEWVLDCHHKSYENAPSDHYPWINNGDCSRRIIRGGSFTNPPDNLRTTKRAAVAFAEKRDNIGFRVVRETR